MQIGGSSRTFGLYIVATPIGNLKDISARAIETLKIVDCVLCEDTRVTAKLLQNIGVQAKLAVYNDHNASSVIPNIVKQLEVGISYALLSDAGMPLVSDPGYKLVNACIENGISYTVIPGACAVVSALALSGLPSDRFMFVGFADSSKFQELVKIDATLIFFEAPGRVVKIIADMAERFSNRTVAVVREITKMYEEVVCGNFPEVLRHFEDNPPRGEFVLLLSPPTKDDAEKLLDLSPLVEELADKVSLRDLSTALAKYSGLSRNVVYKFLLKNAEKLDNPVNGGASNA